MPEELTSIELTFRRKYNLSNWNDKEFTIKLSGSMDSVQKELNENKQKLIGYIKSMEELVEVANDASILKEKAEQVGKEEKSNAE